MVDSSSRISVTERMNDFVSRLLAWYEQHRRHLPWRDHSNPYAVWVSEVMLQQTRVEAVIPYFERWMARFPTLQSLAEASEQEVLRLWEGLGYYSRARNLHRAAQMVMEQFGGVLPRSAEALQRLPGIGRYTAGAIASIAFGLDKPALDGNVRRVYARLFDLELPVDSPEGERRLWELATAHLPSGRAGEFNQALMDLGATLCLPRRPRCGRCPLREDCLAYQRGVQEERPRRRLRAPPPHHVYAAAAIVRPIRGRMCTLLARRPGRGLLGGLWEFPNGRIEGVEPDRELVAALGGQYRLKVQVEAALGAIRHAYTHFRVTVHAFQAGLAGCLSSARREELNLKWVPLTDLEMYPMGKVDRQIATLLLTRNEHAYLAS